MWTLVNQNIYFPQLKWKALFKTTTTTTTTTLLDSVCTFSTIIIICVGQAYFLHWIYSQCINLPPRYDFIIVHSTSYCNIHCTICTLKFWINHPLRPIKLKIFNSIAWLCLCHHNIFLSDADTPWNPKSSMF